MALREHLWDIIDLYKSGQTLQEIGSRYGVTRERVRQILRKHDVAPDVGGAKVRNAETQKRRRDALDRRYLAKWGVTRAEYQRINREFKTSVGTPSRIYGQQRNNARIRGIEWRFNFAMWWRIWEESGKWGNRGRGGDLYVMTRPNDEGPYSPENVVIKTLRENSKEQFDWNHFGGKWGCGPTKPVSPEVLELLELRKLPGVKPNRIERISGLPKGTWNNITKGKSVRPDRYQIFRDGFLSMAKAA